MPVAHRSSRPSAPAPRTSRRIRGLAAIAAAAGIVLAGPARAADQYWQSGTTPGQWSNAAN